MKDLLQLQSRSEHKSKPVNIAKNRAIQFLTVGYYNPKTKHVSYDAKKNNKQKDRWNTQTKHLKRGHK